MLKFILFSGGMAGVVKISSAKQLSTKSMSE